MGGLAAIREGVGGVLTRSWWWVQDAAGGASGPRYAVVSSAAGGALAGFGLPGGVRRGKRARSGRQPAQVDGAGQGLEAASAGWDV